MLPSRKQKLQNGSSSLKEMRAAEGVLGSCQSATSQERRRRMFSQIILALDGI